MRADVVIVLNERESIKKKMAGLLEEHLARLNITSSRIPITENISKKILTAEAKICVLDYILGDFSTGLDVLVEISKCDPAERIIPFFFTDEPDLDVAVEALRLGAINYFLTDDPKSVVNLATSIADTLFTQFSKPLDKIYRPAPNIDQLPFGDKISQTVRSKGRLTIEGATPLTIISGARGSGKRSMARAIGAGISNSATIIERDWSITEFEEIAPLLPRTNRVKRGQLGNGLSLLLYNYDFENGALLHHLQTFYNQIWPEGRSASDQGCLLICSSDSSLHSSWQQLLPCQTIEMPSLGSKGRKDFQELTHFFYLEIKQMAGQKLPAPTTEEIEWLSNQQWPENLSQLRNVLYNGYLIFNSEKTTLVSALEQAYHLLPPESIQEKPEIEEDLLREALILSNFNYKLTAAKFGCSVGYIRDIELGKRQ